MGTRGRKSAASREVAKLSSVQTIQRPDAPYKLTDEQAEAWWAVVNCMPADWFRKETHALLTQRCRHEVQSDRIDEMLQELLKRETFTIKEYDRLLKMQERESKVIALLDTKMRLPQQSTYDRKKAKPIEHDLTWSIRKSHRSDPVDPSEL